MDANTIDLITMIATVFAAIGAVYFAANANAISKSQEGIEKQQAEDAKSQAEKQYEISMEQNRIAARQENIERMQLESEQKPALKFVVCAHFDEKKDDKQSDKEDPHSDKDEALGGYDLCVINYGKAPAVLTLLSNDKYNDPAITKDKPRARIKKRGTDGETGNPYEVLISDLPKEYQPSDTRNYYPIGKFSKAFANSVIIMPQETKVFFRGNKLLSRVCNSKFSKSNDHLNFFFAESVDQCRYWLSTEYTNDENLTLIQTIFDNKPSGDKTNA